MTDPTANDTAPECQEACDCPDNHRRRCWEEHQPVWPQTSERDAHLGAYVLPTGEQHYRKVLRVGDTTFDTAAGEVPVYGFEPVDGECGQPIIAGWKDDTWTDPAPAGLTAAQESLMAADVARGAILRLADLAAAACPDPALHEDLEDACTERCPGREMHQPHEVERLRVELHEARETVAAQVLDMAQLVRGQCSDPALHEDGVLTHLTTALADARQAVGEWDADLSAAREQIAELKSELLKTHTDLEASRAREQLAAERVAELERRVDGAKYALSSSGFSGTAVMRALAILAGDPADGAPTSDEEDRG
jgi:hypothetical protein